MADQGQYSVEKILKDLRNLDSAKELFSELNYDIARDSLSRRDWGKIAAEAVAEDPQVIATHNDFRVIYSRLSSNRLWITQQRAVVNTLLREHPYALFLFSTEDQNLWHFVNVKLASGERDDERNKESKKRRLFRRITIRENERRLRTATQRLSMLDLALIQPELFGGIPPLEIQKRHDKAFDVEEVTKEFYEAYEKQFNGLKDNLGKQTGEARWAHDYALQFLNRLMFLYFVQRKGWLADDDEFLGTFWTAYSKSTEPKDTFFEKWLKVLFFEAFNNQKNLLNTNQRAYMPEQIRKALVEAPYLNGGLFKPNELDTFLENHQKVIIGDGQFSQIFNLFQRYNFTITEDSPLDQEVAVDPEMIGKVYESLVNLTETGMERSAAGIFYTPRTEIDLMCRLSIVDNLANHIGQEHKNLLYEAVFSLDQDEKEQADKNLVEANLWPDVERRLNEITVLDPACGSGSFLVGMIYVLNDLLERAEKQRGQVSGSYERKKRIIGQSLYGVDTMDWACHVAELRLWLALIVDAEFGKEELMIRKEPLLPHFSFKVRSGDSLVQEIGGLDMAHRRGVMELGPNIKRKLTELRNEKGKFYGNDPTCKFKSPEALESHEVLIFRELLEDRSKQLETEAKDLMREQAAEAAGQQKSLLTGEWEEPSKQFTLGHERRERQIEALMNEKQQVEVAVNAVRDRTSVPFVWDIAFAEIFAGEEHGFDIVIGNPPYVRRQDISDPRLQREKVTSENKKEYKTKLAKSVYKEYPSFFKYKTATDKAGHKLDAKSDLYIYFYFHGLSLLNYKGSFCFITSNSWLDVGYGKDLQEFLLNRCYVKVIIDNKAKRSFKQADVNTVIVLFGAPADSKTSDEVSLKKTARFVMFYVPFEEALHPVVFEEIEEAKQKVTVPEYRLFPIKQEVLLSDGCEILKEAEKKKSRGPLIKVAKYIGNKWGGKYLRAPDIYWIILEKGEGKFTRLCDIAEVNEGKPTGANDFFYPAREICTQFQIEKEFLHPGIMKTRGSNYFKIKQNNLERYFLAVDKPKSALKGTGALEYIRFGEKQGLNRRKTFANKKLWYSFKVREPADLLLPCGFGSTFFCALNEAHAVASNSFAELRILRPEKDLNATWIWMNSAICWLYVELMGRTSLGGGMLKTDPIDYRQMPIVKSESFPGCKIEIDREVHTIFEEIEQDDRQVLDTICFDVLDLTKGEREAVYEAIIDLVKSRLKKAASLE